MVLTAYGRALREGRRHRRVQVDGVLRVRDELGIPLHHPLLHPGAELLFQRIHHVAQVLLGELGDLFRDGQIVQNLLVLRDEAHYVLDG
jgi:hypothetical protein